MRKSLLLLTAASVLTLPANMPLAQSAEGTSYTLYGTPGLVDMPTAESAPDGEFSATAGYFAGQTRTTLSFQITPRLSGSFRYSGIQSNVPSQPDTFDRSFDLRYRFLDEGRYVPSMAVGLQDFIGTGIYSAEYVVATKTVRPGLTVTGGLGWGRLGSSGSFTNPLGVFSDRFKTRPPRNFGVGGTVDGGEWFRGPAAFFGGVAWQASDRLTLKAEYSSDDYSYETGRGLFEKKSRFNFGADYRLGEASHIAAYYLYGSEVGISLTYSLNPKRPPVKGDVGPAPLPVAVRSTEARNDMEWVSQPDAPAILRENIRSVLAAEGMQLEALALSPRRAELRIRNNRYGEVAQMIGRASRVLSATLPGTVEMITIVPVVNGIPASSVTLRRSDLERFESAPNGAAEVLTSAQIGDGLPASPDLVYLDEVYPRFTWAVGPYLSASYFDPDEPVRVDVGVKATARYEIVPGLIASGELRKRIAGNQGDARRFNTSALPPVRSNAVLYSREGDPALSKATLAYYFRPGEELYGRVTAGYLERMHGGISTEVLWKPEGSRFALGAELNYTKQRDYDQRFGFQDYDIVTGYVSGYWDLTNGYQAQVDVGRYLAGDWGATLKLEREFKNGWRVGAFATFTDVPFSTFGEGSFDKGLTISVPLSWFTGRPSTETYSTTVRPIVRDGGARVSVDDRLYETLRDYQSPILEEKWGRFWR